MATIFLSASIPDKFRNPKYWNTCDIISIRDCVISLVEVCLKLKVRIVWGGHPAITPLVYRAIENICEHSSSGSQVAKQNIQELVHIFQSKYFEKKFPPDNNKFENVTITPAGSDRKTSLKTMRDLMLDSENFQYGIFIGGMDGVEDEYKLFIEKHPTACLLPIASTGAAAQIIYDKYQEEKNFPNDLKFNNAYYSLFNKYIKDTHE